MWQGEGGGLGVTFLAICYKQDPDPPAPPPPLPPWQGGVRQDNIIIV